MNEFEADFRVHPVTGKLLNRGVREEALRSGGREEVILVPGWYPDDNSDAIHTGEDLRAFEDACRRFRQS